MPFTWLKRRFHLVFSTVFPFKEQKLLHEKVIFCINKSSFVILQNILISEAFLLLLKKWEMTETWEGILAQCYNSRSVSFVLTRHILIPRRTVGSSLILNFKLSNWILTLSGWKEVSVYDTDDSFSQLSVLSSNSDVSKILVLVTGNDSLSEYSDLQKKIEKVIKGRISHEVDMVK